MSEMCPECVVIEDCHAAKREFYLKKKTSPSSSYFSRIIVIKKIFNNEISKFYCVENADENFQSMIFNWKINYTNKKKRKFISMEN